MLIKLDEKEGSLERKKLDGGAHTERYNLMGEGYVHCQHLQSSISGAPLRDARVPQ
jgi:hypothetical protein